MKVSRPIPVSIPPAGVSFAESVHAQDFAMSVRRDPYHKLLYVLRGQVSYREHGRPPQLASAGSLLMIPARARHALVDEHASTLLLLCLSGGFVQAEPELARIWRALTAGPRRLLVVSGPAREMLEHCWRRALLERAHPRPAGGIAARSLALQVFVQLARSAGQEADESVAARVLTVAREVESAFFERWTLDAAAERAAMSRRHFSARFRTAIGRTFWEYLTDVRLAHAAQLLQRGEHSVAGVVFACGFGDVSQFYRLFRARYGRAPKAWAEAKRIG